MTSSNPYNRNKVRRHFMVLSRKDNSLPKMVRRRMIVKRNKSHNSTVGYRCNTIIENCKEICRDTRRKKKKKNAIRAQQP